jgi:hypothetical protein
MCSGEPSRSARPPAQRAAWIDFSVPSTPTTTGAVLAGMDPPFSLFSVTQGVGAD